MGSIFSQREDVADRCSGPVEVVAVVSRCVVVRCGSCDVHVDLPTQFLRAGSFLSARAHRAVNICKPSRGSTPTESRDTAELVGADLLSGGVNSHGPGWGLGTTLTLPLICVFLERQTQMSAASIRRESCHTYIRVFGT